MRYPDSTGLQDAISTISAVREQARAWEQIHGASDLISEALSGEAERLAATGQSLSAQVAAETATVRRAIEDVSRFADPLAGAIPDDLGEPYRWRDRINEATAVRNLPESYGDAMDHLATGISNGLAEAQSRTAEVAAFHEFVAPLRAQLREATARMASIPGRLSDEFAEGCRTFSDLLPRVHQYTEEAMRRLEWSLLGNVLGPLDDLQTTAQRLSAAYRELSWDPSVLGGGYLAEALAPIEVLNHASLLQRFVPGRPVAPQERREDRQQAVNLPPTNAAENTAAVPSLLGTRFPRLLPLWEGAQQALRSENPDRVRHCGVSYRELLVHLIECLTPNEMVIEWLKAQKLNHFKGNKPTRRGRMLFISRRLGSSFGRFMLSDFKALMSVFELLNKGTHSIEPMVSPEELQTRADGLLLLLLQAAEDSSGSSS